MTLSGFRWLLLPGTALLLASCAAPYGGFYGGYAAYGYPAYAYPDDYFAPAYGGFFFGGGHPHFRHHFFGHRVSDHFGHPGGEGHAATSAHHGHGGGHRR